VDILGLRVIPGRRDHQASRGALGRHTSERLASLGQSGHQGSQGLQEQTGLKGLRGRGERRALPVWMEQREQMDRKETLGWWERPASQGPAGRRECQAPRASGARRGGRAVTASPGFVATRGRGVSAALTGSCCDPRQSKKRRGKASLPRAGRCAIDFAAGQATCRGSIKSCVTLWCMVTCN